MATLAHHGRCPNGRILPAAIATLACSASVALTVNFCWQLRDETGLLAGGLAVVIGLAWEMAKLTFAPRGVRYLFSGRATLSLAGLALCGLSVVLVADSVAASLGYLAELDSRYHQAVVKSSTRFHDLKAQLDELGREISILTQAAAADNERSYRRRALETLAAVRRLRSERDEVRQALETLAGTPTAAVAPGQVAQAGVLGGLAGLLQLDVSRVRAVAYGVVAVMLELISIAALLLLGGPGPRPGPVDFAPSAAAARPPAASASAPRTPPILAPTATPAAVALASEGDLSTQDAPDEGRSAGGRNSDGRYGRAKELVMTGTVSPTYRALQNALQLSQDTARAFLDAMVDDGVLVRVGRRYGVGSELQRLIGQEIGSVRMETR